jgi:hypothetical protein
MKRSNSNIEEVKIITNQNCSNNRTMIVIIQISKWIKILNNLLAIVSILKTIWNNKRLKSHTQLIKHSKYIDLIAKINILFLYRNIII